MKSEKFFVSVFLVLIFSFLAMFVFAVTYRVVLKNTVADDGMRVLNMDIDWEKLYPFDKKEEKQITRQSTINKIYSYIKGKMPKYTSEALYAYYPFVEAAKKYEDIINWNMVDVTSYNPVIKRRDGSFTSLTASQDVSRFLEPVVDFSNFCTENGTDFCYIKIPSENCKYEDEDISGILDFSNQNADRFLKLLDNAGIKKYDFRKFLHDDGMNHHEAFFITDGHWKPETGLWAAGKILKILRDDFSWPVDPEILDAKNFDRVIYHDWFLGGAGRKFTLMRAKPEDISLIYPKFETRINFQIPGRNIVLSGDFSVMYDMEQIAVKDYYRRSPLSAYKYGDQPLTIIRNELNHDGKKLLIIHDSMCDCVIPFLALGVGEIFDIDLRHFTGSVRTFIKSHKPDIVIVAHTSPGGVAAQKMSGGRKIL